MVSTKDILNKYNQKIESEMRGYSPSKNISKEYGRFKDEMVSEKTSYKTWVKTLGNLIRLKPSKKEEIKIQKQLDIAHLDITASQALTFSAISLILVFLSSVLLVVSIFLITGEFQLLLLFLGLIASIFVFYYTYSMPQRLANAWRLKASSQMVPAILYIVVYMKHTSNLERAIDFAAQHLEPPLSLDLRKIFYDVEIGRFSTIKQALENYLETWRDYAPEFIESMHLIESSLFEPSEARRVQILEKSLDIVLEGVYEKMLGFSRDIRSPLTNLYMLGIILPTLGLALLPLASTLLGGIIQWQHVFVIFNIIIPFFVFYMTSEVLLKRPGGYGETSVLELNPRYREFISKKPWITGAIIALPLLIIGLIPFMFQMGFLTEPLGLQSDYTFEQIGISLFKDTKLFDFKIIEGSKIGPFGPLAVILSLFIPLSIALFFSTAYKLKTKELIKSRNQTKTLEEEFTNTLFQLGNRLGNGTPAEIAFSKVAETTQGQKTHQFFSLVSQNVRNLGMSLEKAIFDPRRGAIVFFPSTLIATSMRILIESAKKGLQVAARSLMSISEYVKNIKKIDARLRDLLAEVVSDMKSNMVFLAPLLAGIVVGLSTMITLILSRLQTLTASGGGEQELGGFGSIGSITSIFDVTSMIPPYFIQISIGFYLIEIAFILTAALVTVDSGKDTLREKYDLSKNLKRGISIYIFTALLSTIILSALAIISIGGIAS